MTTQQSATLAVREQDVVLSGRPARSTSSARAGFLPISLERVPAGALDDIPVYLRAPGSGPGAQPRDHASEAGFRLYTTESARFGDAQRSRLVDNGVRFIYIRMADQGRFRRQTEARLGDLAADPSVGIDEKAGIIYETSIELMNELLSDPEVLIRSPRLEQVSRAVTSLVINNPTAFGHLLAVSHHDFYTATHMVNVATWMVPLAHELGYTDPDVLNTICRAGLFHDVGKTSVPEDILNKSSQLSDEDWRQIRRHPAAGREYLAAAGCTDPIILAVAGQHHERLDGTGYPEALKGDQIHTISRICAVVDSFDAMTAFRPFKQRTLSITEALDVIRRETPARYDPRVVDAWMRLMVQAGTSSFFPEQPPRRSTRKSRLHPRTTFHCPARAHILAIGPDGPAERHGIAVIAHNISRSGLGFLSQVPMPTAEHVRVYLQVRGRPDRPLDGLIVRCRAHDDTWHEIGMEFAPSRHEGSELIEIPARS